ncbi:amino acid adenylation domain-containing protein [Streptomyces lydicus]
MTADTLQQRFRAVAAAHPDRTAITHNTDSLTYCMLDRLSDTLAAALGQVLAGDRLVAIRVGRGLHTAVAILGVLKSGCGYVPVDPDYPESRQRYILDDSTVRLVVGDSGSAVDEDVVATAGPLTVARRPAAGPSDVPDDTAYVIYTSGSTGHPKGCVVTHGNVLSLMDRTEPLFGFAPDDVWTLFHSISFDFSVWEIWGALLYGARLVTVPKEMAADPASFGELVAREGVTILNQVPSVFSQLEGMLDDKTAWPSLRFLVFGGEAVQPDCILRWLDRNTAPHVEIVNMYGITETTVHVTFCRLTRQSLSSGPRGRSPIGRPLPHLAVSLRDEDGRPVGTDTPGEMWVSGDGVCAGYLGRPELTAERFVPDTRDETGVRYYRSGDWALRDRDGALHYLGRHDHQVKLRGFRIELGEVEAAVRSFPGVRSAVCTVEETRSGYRILVAYVVESDTGTRVEPTALRGHLTKRLPAHMVPQRVKKVSSLPLGPNGKIDTAALADGMASEQS